MELFTLCVSAHACDKSEGKSGSWHRIANNVWSVYLFVGAASYFLETSVFNAKGVDPNQTPHSDLGLHCLPMSLLWDAGLKCFKK